MAASHLILASTSPWRLQMLRDAGVCVQGEAPGVDESLCTLKDPVARAVALGRAKAASVAARHPEAWVLGADQVMWDGQAIHGKPASAVDHLRGLRAMRGRRHALITGWALLGPGLDLVRSCTTWMDVRDDLTDAELSAYVASGEGAGCAGGYAAEGRGAFLFERIDGDWFNVLGLPLLDVIGALREHGWRFDA